MIPIRANTIHQWDWQRTREEDCTILIHRPYTNRSGEFQIETRKAKIAGVMYGGVPLFRWKDDCDCLISPIFDSLLDALNWAEDHHFDYGTYAFHKREEEQRERERENRERLAAPFIELGLPRCTALAVCELASVSDVLKLPWNNRVRLNLVSRLDAGTVKRILMWAFASRAIFKNGVEFKRVA